MSCLTRAANCSWYLIFVCVSGVMSGLLWRGLFSVIFLFSFKLLIPTVLKAEKNNLKNYTYR